MCVYTEAKILKMSSTFKGCSIRSSYTHLTFNHAHQFNYNCDYVNYFPVVSLRKMLDRVHLQLLVLTQSSV